MKPTIILLLLGFSLPAADLSGLTVWGGLGGRAIQEEAARDNHIGRPMVYSIHVDYVRPGWLLGPAVEISAANVSDNDGTRLRQNELNLGVQSWLWSSKDPAAIGWTAGAGLTILETQITDNYGIVFGDRVREVDLGPYLQLGLMGRARSNVIFGAVARYSWVEMEVEGEGVEAGGLTLQGVLGWSF